MADEHGARPQLAHPALEPVEAREVEVVGGLVEQEDVEAREQQRREVGPRGLAPGQGGHLRVEQLGGEAQVVGDLLGALLEVGATEVEPALEGRGVGVVGTRDALGERGRRGLQDGRRGRDPGAASDEPAHGLAGHAGGLLRQVPDAGRRRRHRDGALVGRRQTGQQAQQGRLPGAVDADETDDVPGGDDEVEAGEQHPGAVRGGEVPRDQGGTHDDRPYPCAATAFGAPT